ncbi:TIGR02186 family protein [Microbaculum sp. FT89]|uniref:TIGR02186 family protein n=1 Tax=Microbaculum sp. FT89 TaxID=3447298 RepID=UPI003F533FF9
MMRSLLVLAIASLAAVAASAAQAETVIAALSSKRIEIRSNFVGTELVLFGTVERDAATVGRRSEGYDVAIVIEGPANNMVVWRKERAGGIWVNGAGVEFKNAPSYYAVLTNRPLEEISSPPALKRQQIGLDFLRIETATDQPKRVAAEFRNALLRREQSNELYFENSDAVEMLTPRMFMAQIPLPANIRTGGYRARVHVFGDGALLATEKLGFWVVKTGFEAAIFNLAHRQPLIYGLGTVAMAFGVGWLGSVLFRRG